MATTTIHGLAAITSAASADELALWRAADGTTRRITWANALGGYLLATGATTGATSQAQTFTNGINGSTSANGDISIRGTSHATKTTSYVLLQEDGGNVGIGETAPARPLHIKNTAAQLRIEDAVGGYLDWNTNNDGSSGILNDIDIIPSGAAGNAVFRFFRNTNTSGAVAFDIARGNNSGTINCRLSGNGDSYLSTALGKVGIGSASPLTLLDVADTNAGTSAVQNAVTLRSTNSGTPAAGFGVGLRAGLKSSTTADQDAGRLTWAWSTATHASRAAVGKLTAYYTSTEREAITWVADSTAVKIGLNGTSPSYMLDGLAPAGAQNILRLGQTGVSNGLQITSSGSALTYIMADGKLGINTTPTYYLDGLAPAGTQSIFRFGQTGVSNGFSVSSDGSNLTYTMETGKLGVGVTSPQSIVHAHDGSGGFMFINRSGVSSTLVTVIPDGTGDVTENISYFGWCSNSSGVTFQIADGYQAVSSSTTKTDGSNTLTFAVTAGGAFTLQATAGAATWKVCIWAFWR